MIIIVEEAVKKLLEWSTEAAETEELEAEVDLNGGSKKGRLFRRALSSLLGSIEAAAAARACPAPVLTFGFYDYFLRFIGAVFDAKGADAILSFEKFCCNLPRPLLQSMLAGLESLLEAYQQRMASMMEQVQIRDRLHPKKVQEKFLQERIKVGGKAGALGDSVIVSREKNKR
ncbi:hypothetical protein HN51_047036 [Arachis hypogaea]